MQSKSPPAHFLNSVMLHGVLLFTRWRDRKINVGVITCIRAAPMSFYHPSTSIYDDLTVQYLFLTTGYLAQPCKSQILTFFFQDRCGWRSNVSLYAFRDIAQRLCHLGIQKLMVCHMFMQLFYKTCDANIIGFTNLDACKPRCTYHLWLEYVLLA